MLRYWILAISLKPTIFSADTSLMNGKPDSFAILAARAVLPDHAGPCKRTESNEVVAEFLTRSTNNRPSLRIFSIYGL